MQKVHALDDSFFKLYFRLCREDFYQLLGDIQHIKPEVNVHQAQRSSGCAVSIELRLCLALLVVLTWTFLRSSREYFGLLVARFGVFWRPLSVKFSRIAILVRVCCKLHNICVRRFGISQPGIARGDSRPGDSSVTMYTDGTGMYRGCRSDLRQTSGRELLTDAGTENYDHERMLLFQREFKCNIECCFCTF